jgi:hypothetical protein
MRRLFLLGFLAFSITATAAIDFTPTVSEYTAEGLKFHQLSFKDGTRRIIFEPPQQWTCHGTTSMLRLAPSNTARAEAIVQAVEAKASDKLDDKALAACREQFLAGLPTGSQGGEITKEEFNPVQLERASSYAITGQYKAIGEVFICSVVFVNLPESQLTFRLTARKADFATLDQAFRRSILSWHWVGPNPPTTVVQK